MMRRSLTLIMALSLLLAAVSCSTTRALGENECRLVENKVIVEGEDGPPASELESYIKQKPNTYFIGKWNPFLYVYNWSRGKGSEWDLFFEKLGVAPVVFNPFLVDGSNRGILSHMEYLGYYGSDVHAEVDVADQKAKVTYIVKPGKRFVIDTLRYEVRDSNLVRYVLRDSSLSVIQPGTFLSQKVLEDESEKMASRLRNMGFYGFTKNYYFFTADTSAMDGTADLTVNVEDYTRNEQPAAARPHLQYRFGNVNIHTSGRTKIRPGFLEDINRIKPGNLYMEAIVDNTYSRFSSLGLFNSVNIQLQERDSALVDCDINLASSKLQSIKMNLEGSTNSTGLFGITPSVSYSHRNLFGGGELFSLGLRGNFQFRLYDPTHSNEFAMNSSIIFPRFVPLPARLFKSSVPQTEVSLLFNYQSRPEYTRNIVSLGYGYNWSVKRRYMYQVYPIKLNFVRIYNISDDFYSALRDPYLRNAYQNHLDFGSGANLYFTTSPTVNAKRSYFYTRLNVDVAGNVLSLLDGILPDDGTGSHTIAGVPYAQYLRGELQAVQTLRFGRSRRWSFAVRGLAGAGYAYGNSYALPFEKLFYAGGANSLRGWQARSVGPGNAPLDKTFAIANQSGDMHLETNAELRFPLFWKLQGGLFVDAGNIWYLHDDVDHLNVGVFHWSDCLQTTALDWGFGLRLDFDMLLVRLDAGFKAHDPLTQSWTAPKSWFSTDGYAIHFGIGYPF
ncbi:MAG: BamA/TamA family outer membrane protein [Bacteroidales bacterium]|nr:BamA/TamA family outer membrane protein [Bacteroidales bacterium]